MSEINPGIRRLVALFNSVGLTTVDSGDGETHDFECDRDVGYVVINVDPRERLQDEADLVYKMLVDRGVSMGPDACHVQANYAPFDGFALIDVNNIRDSDVTFKPEDPECPLK